MDWVGLRHNGGKNMSLTDQIYGELVDGLKTGDLDWTAFIAKHSGSKGPLYNAIGRFFNDMEPKVKALNEVQRELDQGGLKLDQLNQQVKEAESNLAPLEERKGDLIEQNETLKAEIAEKSELLEQARELAKLGFDIERLRQLRDALTEIGAKSGLKGKEAVSKFFAELKDYDAKTGFEAEIQRLGSITETKKLEAENWQAKAERLESQYSNFKEATDAIQALLKRGVKADQIVSWNKIVSVVGDPKELENELGNYKSIRELLNVRRQESAAWQVKIAQAQSQVEILEKERAKIEAAINALEVAGVKQLEAMAEATEKQIKAVATKEIGETRAVGQEVRREFGNLFAQLDALAEKIFELGQKWEGIKQEFQKYEGVKNVLESHVATSEEVNEPIPK